MTNIGPIEFILFLVGLTIGPLGLNIGPVSKVVIRFIKSLV